MLAAAAAVVNMLSALVLGAACCTDCLQLSACELLTLRGAVGQAAGLVPAASIVASTVFATCVCITSGLACTPSTSHPDTLLCVPSCFLLGCCLLSCVVFRESEINPAALAAPSPFSCSPPAVALPAPAVPAPTSATVLTCSTPTMLHVSLEWSMPQVLALNNLLMFGGMGMVVDTFVQVRSVGFNV